MKERKYSLFIKLIRLMAPLRAKLCLAVCFAVAGFLVSVLIPYFILQQTFLVLDNQSVNWLLFGCLLVSFGVLRGVFRYGEHYFGHYIAFRVLAEFRNRVFHKLRKLVPTKLDTKQSGVLLKLIGEDIEAIEVFFAHTLPPILTATIVTLLLMSYYASLSIELALVALVTYSLLAIVIPVRFANVLDPMVKAQSHARQDYMAYFLESLKGMTDLVQFNRTSERFTQLNERSQNVTAKERQVYQKQAVQLMLTFLIVGLSILSVALLGIYLVDQQRLSLPEAVMGTVVFSSSFAPYLELSRLPFGLKKALKAAADIFELLEEAEPTQTGEKTLQTVGKIHVKAIDFSYPQRESLIFEQQTVNFPKNKIIGIIGESGSGKSTLMKLIMKWYAIQSGDVTIDDISLAEINRQHIQKQIAYIPQIPQIFSQTIRENVTLGRPILDEQILAIAEKCQMKERILSTPQGLDTLINSEQIIFSSGEKQRLELMRALLSDVSCYIFDEPTSYLDSLNEALFLTIIKKHCQGTVFLISHRNSTVACADVIYKVENKTIKKVEERE